jgi:hypothetical protein
MDICNCGVSIWVNLNLKHSSTMLKLQAQQTTPQKKKPLVLTKLTKQKWVCTASSKSKDEIIQLKTFF